MPLQEFTLVVELSLRPSLCCESVLFVQRSVLMFHSGIMYFLKFLRRAGKLNQVQDFRVLRARMKMLCRMRMSTYNIMSIEFIYCSFVEIILTNKNKTSDIGFFSIEKIRFDLKTMLVKSMITIV